MSDWTPEPWDYDGGEIFALADPDCPLASVHDTSEGFEGADPVAHANARRIVACVNLCRGIPTEAVEAMRPGWWQRNAELLAACDAVSEHLARRLRDHNAGCICEECLALTRLDLAILAVRPRTPPA